jgi:hypothetical protein
MLGYVYGQSKSSHILKNQLHFHTLFELAEQALNPYQDLGVKVATPCGTLVGQLLFGWLADVVGRKRMCKFVDTGPLIVLIHKQFRWS